MINFDVLKVGFEEHQELEIDALKSLYTEHFEEISTQFEQFYVDSTDLLNKISDVMAERIPTDPVLLEDILDRYSAFSYTLGQSVTDAQTYVQIYEILFHEMKKAKLSEGDRKKTISGKIIKQEYILQSLKNADEKLSRKITICQSTLKSETARLIKEK